MENLIQLGTGAAIISYLLINSRSNKEEFSPFLKSNQGLSILNNNNINTGKDFKLVDYTKKLKLHNTLNSSEDLKLSPVILVPGFGACKILYRQIGNSKWKTLWPPEGKKFEEIFKTKVTDGDILLRDDIEFSCGNIGDLHFTDGYMEALIKALEAVGYKKGVNLFGACYDFRTIGTERVIDEWCKDLKYIVESSSMKQGYPAVIIGHDLGASLTNYFLVNSNTVWKRNYVDKFISLNGTMGGSQKALKVLLTGDELSNKITNTLLKTTSGLSLILPSEKVHTRGFLKYRGINYKEIASVLKSLPRTKENNEILSIYNITENIRTQFIKPPGVETHLLVSDNIDTECYYNYHTSLIDKPVITKSKGSGIMCDYALGFPSEWEQLQNEDVYLLNFPRVDHNKILDVLESVKYILTKL